MSFLESNTGRNAPHSLLSPCQYSSSPSLLSNPILYYHSISIFPIIALKRAPKKVKQVKKQQNRLLTTKKPVQRAATQVSTPFTPKVLTAAAKSQQSPRRLLFTPFARFSTSNPNYQQDGKEVEDRVFTVLRSFDKVNKDKLSSNAHLQNDLGLDSLDRVEVVLAVEEEFNMEFSDEQSDKFASVNEIVDFIARQPNVHLRNYKPDDI
jgi:NADH dehydrogenase (ubiquinone) 1 alpha/beta subcomplex 1